MQRRTHWVPYRIDVARGVQEATLTRVKNFACGRCGDEVAQGAVWCPHCGFDMTDGGTVERSHRMHALPWRPSFDHARIRLIGGSLAAAVVVVMYLLVSLRSGTQGLYFGGFTFVLATWALSADLSLNGLMCTAPTILATLTFLDIK